MVVVDLLLCESCYNLSSRNESESSIHDLFNPKDVTSFCKREKKIIMASGHGHELFSAFKFCEMEKLELWTKD